MDAPPQQQQQQQPNPAVQEPPLKMKILNIIRFLCGVGCIGLSSVGCYGFYLGFDTTPGASGGYSNDKFDGTMILISFYMVMFGLIGLLAECRMTRTFSKFGFLASRFGRGVFYIFIGSFAVVQGEAFCVQEHGQCLTFATGIFVVTNGILYILTYFCYRTRQAGEYFSPEARANLLGQGADNV